MSEPSPDEFRAFLISKFEAFMAEHGKRMTRERRLVLEVVFRLASPFAVEDVMAGVGRTKGQLNVSRSTLYRTLHDLKASGLIRCEAAPNGSELYYHTFALPSPPGPTHSACESTHATMIAGTCPWCGRAIIQGEVRDE